MVNISIYPYGNANERQNKDGSWTFTCQHGTIIYIIYNVSYKKIVTPQYTQNKKKQNYIN